MEAPKILQSFVEKVATTSAAELSRQFRGEPAPAPKAPAPKRKRGRKMQTALKSGLALELARFLTKHGLTYNDLAEMSEYKSGYLRLLGSSRNVPSQEATGHLRKVMSDYEAGLNDSKRFTPKPAGTPPAKLQTTDPIEKLGIDGAMVHRLNNTGIRFIGDLVGRTWVEVFKKKAIGRNTMNELEAALHRNGLAFRKDPVTLETPIVDCGFAFLASQRLATNGVKTLGDLLQKTPGEIRKMPLGITAIRGIQRVLADYNRALKGMSVGQDPFPAPTQIGGFAVPPRRAEAPAPAPAPATAPCTKPHLTLRVDNAASVRLNSGDNVAPHLRLDGKTMHVFTLVPGGVFVSYVEVVTENR